MTAAGGGRREVTLPVLDALIEKLGGRAPRDCEDDEPGWHGGKPVRGFVVPPVEAVPPDEVSPPDERE